MKERRWVLMFSLRYVKVEAVTVRQKDLGQVSFDGKWEESGIDNRIRGMAQEDDGIDVIIPQALFPSCLCLTTEVPGVEPCLWSCQPHPHCWKVLAPVRSGER